MPHNTGLALAFFLAVVLTSSTSACSIPSAPSAPSAPTTPAKEPPRVVQPGQYSYEFAVPQGWDSSMEEAPLFGVRVMFFELGTDFHEAISVMYVTEPCTKGCADLDEQIEQVLAKAREESPALEVSRAEPLPTGSGKPAEVRILTGAKDARQAREALAFVARPEVVLLLVLSTRDTSRWDRDYHAFSDLVLGLEFLPVPPEPPAP